MLKYRLYPSKSQTKILEEQLELCHQTYNWLLLQCRSSYKETGKLLTQFDLNKALIALKRQRPETKKVHSQVLQNISKRIKDAYTVFFARRGARARRRSDFLHKASRRIADAYEAVYVEDLRIGNMVRNHHLAKSIGDAGWGRFIGMIAYKEEESGGQIIRVDANGTTQMCSGCGETVPKDLCQRIHRCPHCGLVLDRDLNAALNVLGRGREIGREPPEYTPVGEETAIQPQFVEQVSSMNQEASLLVGR